MPWWLVNTTDKKIGPVAVYSNMFGSCFSSCSYNYRFMAYIYSGLSRTFMRLVLVYDIEQREDILKSRITHDTEPKFIVILWELKPATAWG